MSPSFLGSIAFPFLFGGTFIEGYVAWKLNEQAGAFPFLFGGTFIEGIRMAMQKERRRGFPFLFGGTFIEGGAHA